jgi:mRNA interferase MazF
VVRISSEPRQRDIWWAEIATPKGSTAGFARPVVILQCDALSVGKYSTYLCAPLTSNLRSRVAAWNYVLEAGSNGLDRDSVAQMALVLTIDRMDLHDHIGQITARQLDQLFRCLDIALGR